MMKYNTVMRGRGTGAWGSAKGVKTTGAKVGLTSPSPLHKMWMYENVFLACQRGFRAHLVFKVLQLHSFIASFIHVFCSIPAKHAA